MATQQPITWICSPGVVELVRSNLAPDLPLFHALHSGGIAAKTAETRAHDLYNQAQTARHIKTA